MQLQVFNLIYSTFRKLCLSDKINKLKESDTVRQHTMLLGHQQVLMALIHPSWVPQAHLWSPI